MPSCLPRRWTAALLLLMALVLPLRGWAHVAMHAERPAPAAAAAEAATPPCHGAGEASTTAPAHAHAAAPADAGTDDTAALSCAMCDLCHAAAAPLDGTMAVHAFAPPRVDRAVPAPEGCTGAPAHGPPRA